MADTNLSIFVCGCQRSGTTAIYGALSRHSALLSRGVREKELWFFTELFDRPDYRPYRSHPLDEQYLRESIVFIDTFIRQRSGSAAGHYITGHPSNIMFAHTLHEVLPHAKFIMLVRDPLDTVASMLNAPFAVEAGWRDRSDRITESDVERAAEIWRSRARVALDAIDGKLANSTKVVWQEALMLHPEAELTETLAFLGLPFESDCGEFLASTMNNSSYAGDRSALGVKERLALFEANHQKARAHSWASRLYELCQPEASLLGYGLCNNSMTREPAVAGQLFKPVSEYPRSTTEYADPSRRSICKIRSAGIFKSGVADKITKCVAGDRLLFRVVVESSPRSAASVSFRVRDDAGQPIFGTTTFDENYELPLGAIDELVVQFEFSARLRPGVYTVDCSLNTVTQRDYSDNLLLHQFNEAARFIVEQSSERPVHYMVDLPVVCSHRIIGHPEGISSS